MSQPSARAYSARTTPLWVIARTPSCNARALAAGSPEIETPALPFHHRCSMNGTQLGERLSLPFAEAHLREPRLDQHLAGRTVVAAQDRSGLRGPRQRARYPLATRGAFGQPPA